MNIIRRTNSLFPVFNSIFDDNLIKNMFEMPTSFQVPAVNIKEEENHYEIEMAAPGLKKKDFNVELDNNVLTISVEKEQEKEDKHDTYTRKEFNYTSFRRSFTLPENDVDMEKIDAKYQDGVLHIMIPKLVKEENKKLVSVH